MTVRLDDPAVIAARDPGGMLSLVSALPDQCDEALGRARQLRMPSDALECSHLLVAGMGGSAIAGDLAATVAEDALADRVRVHRGWGLPAWTTPEFLVVAASYSGNAPETLSAYDAARSRDIPVVVVSSGGELARRAGTDGVPWIRLEGGMPPRAAVAELFFPIRQLTLELGIGRSDEDDAGLASVLRAQAAAYAPGEAAARNTAMRLAQHLAGRLPLVHSGAPLTHAVARRFVSQLAENAKRLAVRSEYPELAHNEVVAWDGDAELLASLAVVELTDPEDPRGVGVVREGVEELAAKHGAAVMRISGTGSGRLTRLWSLLLLTDFASVYVGLLEDRDPSRIEPITWLRGRVAGELKGTPS